MKAHCRCADAASTSPRCVPTAARPRCTVAVRPHGCLQQVHSTNPRSFNSVNAASAVPIQKPETLTSNPSYRVDATSGFASDILGLGQAIVDLSSSVSEDALNQFNVAKGGRRVITVDERASVMETLDDLGAPSQVSAGGSLANTLVAVAKLSRAAGNDLRVTLGGSLGTDTLGQFFNSQMRQAGVRCLLDAQHHTHNHHHHSEHLHQPSSSSPSAPTASVSTNTNTVPAGPSGHTGTVMVLTTPDAQRSFLSFFTSEHLTLSDRVHSAVRSSRLVVIEGYLWEMPGAEEYISQVLEVARGSGAQVAMTAGDPGVVSRHREEMLRVIDHGVDMLFTNEDEAAALAGIPITAGPQLHSTECCQDDDGSNCSSGKHYGERAALALAGRCPVTVVTAGSRGSYICAMGELHVVPPYWLPQGPVDTCGAGDAYAAGWLYALLAGYDLRTAGDFAARVASAVIGRYGPHLSDEDAEELVGELPGHMGPALCSRRMGGMELGAGDFADF